MYLRNQAIKFVNAILSRAIGLRLVRSNQFLVPSFWPAQLLFHSRVFSVLERVEGCIVECGVSTGNSLAILAILVRQENKGRRIYGFDSFAGLPSPTKEDYGSPHGLAKRGSFGSASPTSVYATLRSCGFDSKSIEQMIVLRKGLFSDTLPGFQGGPIALLHIDADLYESYKTCLEVFWDRMAVSGVVVFDEYHRPNRWPGAKAAVDEFQAQHKDDMRLCEDPGTGRFYAIKLK